ncbi:ABC transporter permease [Pontibacter sp. G13]|uniref:ABC transporter permease n=1 Tax=Pontibacter sp. G13 TaxID=3074898 RepID=UPI00288B5E0F|nr:ABC transporter permease [Pontibacter sp. G13]WNJ17294.1 ABC transporter permease [Pontibacter sp. G13]
MNRHYFTLAVRHLKRRWGYALITTLGLSLGMAACMLILLFVQHELSYDKYHEHSDRIYRISREWFTEDGETMLHLGHVAAPAGAYLQEEYSHLIASMVRFMQDEPLLTYEDKQFLESGFFFADTSVFSMFSWEFVPGMGEPSRALGNPNSVVLTESFAQKMFGDENPIGKVINYQQMADLQVTGVIRDIPENSHFKPELLASFLALEHYYGRENVMQSWGGNNYGTYVMLKPGVEPATLKSEIPGFLDRHLGEWNGVPASNYNTFHFWPLDQVHLHSHLDSEIGENGDIRYIYLYSIVALFILVIACVNFINLTTAQSGKRAREVGLRKVVGAHRWMLIRQFLAETGVMAFIALVGSLLWVELVLPYFNNFANRSLSLDLFSSIWIWFILGGVFLVTGLLAGGYPAMVLSKFEPVKTLKGQATFSKVGHRTRSVLVVLQFTISISLIISVGILQDHLAYIHNMDPGFNRSSVMILPISDEMYAQYPRIQSQLLDHPGITDVTMASRVPTGRLLDSQGGSAEIDGEMVPFEVRVSDVHVSHEYLTTFEVDLLAGRDFDPKLASDSAEAFVLNEASVKAIGWNNPQDAIGKKLNYGERTGRVIGVCQDFHFESIHQSIAPIVLMISQGRARTISVRYVAAAQTEVMAYLTDQWTRYRPGYPFTYEELEANFDAQYSEEENLRTLIMVFSGLAVVIAILGLLGLASYAAERRFREIGIRKVMGASQRQILVMLTTRFTKLVLISCGFAMVLTYILMKYLWLDQFAYHAPIGIKPFAFGILGALILTWLTVAFHAWRAASQNPVDSIRYE